MPRVGSSRMRRLGPDTRARASTTFCWLPPDNCPTGLAASEVAMARVLIISCANSSCSPSERRRSQPRFVCSPRTMFSRTLSSPKRPSILRSSGQNAIPWRSDRPGDWLVIRSPPTVRLPESDRIAPKISLATSVRPDPRRPARPTTSPARIWRSNGAITRRRPSPSAMRIGVPIVSGREDSRRSSVCSSSRPSMSEISFSGSKSAVLAEPTRRPLRRTDMRSAIR